MEEEVKTTAEGLPEKTPKQLKKEAEKADKLAKLAAKQEKLRAVQASVKPKKEVAEKPKKEEIEGDFKFTTKHLCCNSILKLLNSSCRACWWKKECWLSYARILQPKVRRGWLVFLVGKRRIFFSWLQGMVVVLNKLA